MSQTAETLIVIGAGLPRTGTTSMKIALEILLNQPCYHMAEIVTKRHCDILKWQSLIDEANKSHGTSVDHRLFKEIFHGYAAVTDAPACGFYKHLMDIYPNSKVSKCVCNLGYFCYLISKRFA
ncbi:unnamed protein product [Trichobilharzia regenti]|nr:unnamed protein product [Trichobilharzia regenti]